MSGGHCRQERLPASDEVASALARQGVVDQQLLGSGTIEPVAQATVAFPIAGTVASVDVAVGAQVSSGEKLGLMDILTSALARQKVSSVFVEHDMDMVERYAHRVAVWSSGKIQVVGPPAEILRNTEVREHVIGI